MAAAARELRFTQLGSTESFTTFMLEDTTSYIEQFLHENGVENTFTMNGSEPISLLGVQRVLRNSLNLVTVNFIEQELHALAVEEGRLKIASRGKIVKNKIIYGMLTDGSQLVAEKSGKKADRNDPDGHKAKGAKMMLKNANSDEDPIPVLNVKLDHKWEQVMWNDQWLVGVSSQSIYGDETCLHVAKWTDNNKHGTINERVFTVPMKLRGVRLYKDFAMVYSFESDHILIYKLNAGRNSKNKILHFEISGLPPRTLNYGTHRLIGVRTVEKETAPGKRAFRLVYRAEKTHYESELIEM